MRVIDYGRLLLLARSLGRQLFVYAHHHPGLRGDEQRFSSRTVRRYRARAIYSACRVNGAGIRENSYPL